MNEETTQNISGGDARSFEERVFARFDAIDARFNTVDARLEKLEAKQYDTKPIWEQALKEIADMRNELVETRRELVDTKRQLSRRLDRIELVVVATRSGLHDIEDRVDGIEGRVEKLEAKPTQ